MKICKDCKVLKPLSEYHKAKTGSQGVMAVCSSCRSGKKAEEYKDRWFHYQYRLKKSYCNVRGIDFNLTTDYLKSIWTERCPVFGREFVRFEKSHPDSPTLDRINPKKGYVQGNVVYISSRANRIKYDATLDELYKLIQWYEGATTISKESTPKWVEAVSPSKDGGDIVCSHR